MPNKRDKKLHEFSRGYMKTRFSNLNGLAVRSKTNITIKEGGKRE